MYENELEQLSSTDAAKQWYSQLTSDDNYNPLITYFFVNKGLNMSVGKTAVQTARAAQVMLLNELSYSDSLLLTSLGELSSQSFMRGNKTITLKANENQMKRILFGDLNEKLIEISLSSNTHIRLYPVFDIGATEVEVNSLTVIAMTPVKKDLIHSFTKKFQLL